MPKNLNPKDYQTLFRLDVLRGRVTGLLSDFIINGSLSLGDPLITFDGRWWTFRLFRAKEKLLAKKGLALFRSKDRYSKYAKDFRRCIDFLKKNVISKYKKIPEDITEKDFSILMEKMKKIWYFYGITESVYHDLAYQKISKSGNRILTCNLKDLNKLKFEGRAVLNAFILENGTIDNILKCVARKYSVDSKIIRYFYHSELKDLFRNKKLNINLIKQREKSFLVYQNNKKPYYIEFKEAHKIAKAFTKFEQAEFKSAANGLKGQSAYKGVVTGRVVISPMLDMKAAMEVEKRMKKGDILVVQSTNPDLMALCNKAGAIVTNQGGMLSHAAIISRELKTPCIVGTTNATKVFKDGDLVEVDADKGIVKILKRK